MKARVQTVDQLKKMVARELESEFQARCEQAILDGAMQGIAFVMFTLEKQYGWKDARQKKLFESMEGLMDVLDAMPWTEPYRAMDLKTHLEEAYGLDFKRLLERADTEVL